MDKHIERKKTAKDKFDPRKEIMKELKEALAYEVLRDKDEAEMMQKRAEKENWSREKIRMAKNVLRMKYTYRQNKVKLDHEFSVVSLNEAELDMMK
jgi:hypothetical protein